MFGWTIKHTNLGNATWSFLPMVWWFFYYYGDHFTAEACEKATFWKRELGALSYERYTWGTLNISSDFPLKAKSLQLFFISDVCKYKRWICFSSVWYWRYVHVAVQFLDFLKFAFWNFQMIDLRFFHLCVWVYETEGSVHEDFFAIIILIITIITIVFLLLFVKKHSLYNQAITFGWLR